MLVNEEHPLNDSSPMLVIFFGNTSDVNELQSRNALSPIVNKESGNAMGVE